MPQTTFDDIRNPVQVHQLSLKDRRILSFLKEGNTQSQTSRKLKVSRATVNQIVRKLEKAKLIRKKWEGNYNIIYDVYGEAEPALKKGGAPKITTIRVHNVRRKRKVLTAHYRLSLDKRTGYEKDWMMRGKVKWYAYSFLGGIGEPSVTLHIAPKTIVGFLDAKQYVIAATVEEAEDKARQYIDQAIEKFIRVQSEFGVQLKVEGVSVPISNLHYGGMGRTDHPAVQEVLDGKVKDWFGDQSLDELGINGLTEVETLVRKNALQFEKAMNLSDALPSMIWETITPLSENVLQVKAMMQGEVTMQRQYEQMMKFMTSALAEMAATREEIRELNRK